MLGQDIKQRILSHHEKRLVKGLKVLNNDTNYFHKHLKRIGKAL